MWPYLQEVSVTDLGLQGVARHADQDTGVGACHRQGFTLVTQPYHRSSTLVHLLMWAWGRK